MAPGPLNLTVYRGTTFGPVQVNCKDSNGAAVNLTGWTARAQVRPAYDKSLILDLEPEIVTGTGGQITFGLSDEETENLPVGEYIWDLMLEKPTGEILPPILAGSFSIKTKVTRRA